MLGPLLIWLWVLFIAAGISALLGIIRGTAVSLPRVIRAYRDAVRDGIRDGNERWERVRPSLEQRLPFVNPPSAE